MIMVALFTILSSVSVNAQKFAGIYGPEFSFGSLNGRLNDRNLESFRTHTREHLVDKQYPESRFERFYSSASRGGLSSPNGWWFTSEIDSGVLEVQMKPMKAGTFAKHASDIQDAIFTSAANIDLTPLDYLGGGHINLSISSFDGDALLIRNFLADYFNHNELAMGALNYDTNNALPLWLHNVDTIGRVKSIFEFYQFSIAKGESSDEVLLSAFLSSLGGVRENANDIFSNRWGNRGPRGKSTDISLIEAKENRLEIRAVRPQKSIYRWIKQIELIDARINYLKTKMTAIPLAPLVPIIPERSEFKHNYHLNPPVDPQLALRSFYNYITESGLKWADYKEDVWPRWQTEGEVAKFEASEWFQQRSKSCGNLL